MTEEEIENEMTRNYGLGIISGIEQASNKVFDMAVDLFKRNKDEMPDKDGWVINPLPLLTACGNGRGGGDYHSQYPDQDKVGIWAGDVLSIEFAVPKRKWYKKLVVSFSE